MRPIAFALSLAVLLPASAGAGETPWQEVAPGVSLRLISTGTITADGKTLVALETRMPETTKTYWRVPGQAGLPTEVDLAGSTGVTGHSQLWPYPQRHQQDGLLDYVYFGNTVLPIELQVSGDAPEVKLEATMGICSEICVPAQAAFTLPLKDAAADSPNGLRIRQALAEVPLPLDETAAPIEGLAWTDSGDALAIRVDTAALDPDSLIAATRGGQPVFGAPQKSPQPDLVVLPILGKSDNIGSGDLPVILTFMTDRGAFEVELVVGGDASAPVQ